MAAESVCFMARAGSTLLCMRTFITQKVEIQTVEFHNSLAEHLHTTRKHYIKHQNICCLVGLKTIA